MTAVEWLIEQIQEQRENGDTDLRQTLYYCKEAKEMEKQQIIDFANDLLAQNDKNYISLPDLAEQYYTETYE